MRKPWVPKSRSVISPKIWPRIHPFLPKYAPVSTPSSYLSDYRAKKNTEASYWTKNTLCTIVKIHNLLGTRSAFVDFFERSQITWLILLNISRPTHSTFFVKARKTSRESSVNQVSVSFLRHSSKQQLHQAKLYQTHTTTKLCRFLKLYVSFKTNLLTYLLTYCL